MIAASDLRSTLTHFTGTSRYIRDPFTPLILLLPVDTALRENGGEPEKPDSYEVPVLPQTGMLFPVPRSQTVHQ